MFEYVNVSPFSHIGILRRHLPQQELDKALFWQSLRATNLDSAMVLYERLSVPEVREDARESLILQLTRAAQTAFDNRLPALTEWRLKQARSLVKPDETNHRVLETLKQMAEIGQSLSRESPYPEVSQRDLSSKNTVGGRVSPGLSSFLSHSALLNRTTRHWDTSSGTTVQAVMLSAAKHLAVGPFAALRVWSRAPALNQALQCP